MFSPFNPPLETDEPQLLKLKPDPTYADASDPIEANLGSMRSGTYSRQQVERSMYKDKLQT